MRLRQFLLEHGMYLTWAVALTATLGSLYFSEVLHYIPCKLCWYQRILMYPLVVILGAAAVRKDYKQAIYVLPLSVIGGVISIYHYLIQKTTLFEHASNSCGIVPCDVDYLDWFGFITIPLLALIAFTLITILQIVILRSSRSIRP